MLLCPLKDFNLLIFAFQIDTKVQLNNVQQLRVVRYKYNPEFARLVGLSEEEAMDTGVIAQEVQKVIPEAVKETGDLDLGNGHRIENFLVVNKVRTVSRPGCEYGISIYDLHC